MNIQEMNSTDFDNFVWETCERVKDSAGKVQSVLERSRQGEETRSPEELLSLYKQHLLQAIAAIDAL